MHSKPSRAGTWLAPAFALAVLVLAPAEGRAQEGAVGMGFRFSLVRGSTLAAGADRYAGGVLRARLSGRSALELALDYRSQTTDDLTRRVRDLPIQVSYLMYPIRAPLAPYVLGGVGWYAQTVDVMAGTTVVATETTRALGYHAGLGGELRLGRHVGLHADYRYTFIGFNDADEGREPGAVPVPGTGALQRTLRLSHKGSMWTGGVTVYF